MGTTTAFFARRELHRHALDRLAVAVNHQHAFGCLARLNHHAQVKRLADFDLAGRLRLQHQHFRLVAGGLQRHDIDFDGLGGGDQCGVLRVAFRLVAVGQQHDAAILAVGEHRAREAQRGGDVRAVGGGLGVDGGQLAQLGGQEVPPLRRAPNTTSPTKSSAPRVLMASCR
jgi:hypothetical protein